MRLRNLTLDQLTIEDERSFRHVALYDALKEVLRRDGFRFRVPEPGSRDATWDRVLFLNLTFWSAQEPADVLVDDHIAADVVAHAAWHHLARKSLPAASSADALLLGEAIASAFDLYLVGRLLGHAPDSDFLRTQVPAMAEVAQAAGMAERDFEALLEGVAEDPDRAFEDLRQLLFDAGTALMGCADVDAGAAALEGLDARRFAPLLHHYELSNWVLYARAYTKFRGDPDTSVRGVDALLRSAPVALDWLETHWIGGTPVAKPPSLE